MKRFYLGTHHPGWLAKELPGSPRLCVSYVQLSKYKTLPIARAPWMQDSGGFTQLQRLGSWDSVPIETYIDATRRARDECGNLEWVAPQDWMCEPEIIDGGWLNGNYCVGTKLSVYEHIKRTVYNGLELMYRASDLPWRYALQGMTLDDYLHCRDLYDAHGVDLTKEPFVALGSVCRRQATNEIGMLVRALASEGLRLHGLGVKISGIRKYGSSMHCADSLAWSYRARKSTPMPECAAAGRHKNCANCPIFATNWYHEKIVPYLID